MANDDHVALSLLVLLVMGLSNLDDLFNQAVHAGGHLLGRLAFRAAVHPAAPHSHRRGRQVSSIPRAQTQGCEVPAYISQFLYFGSLFLKSPAVTPSTSP